MPRLFVLMKGYRNPDNEPKLDSNILFVYGTPLLIDNMPLKPSGRTKNTDTSLLGHNEINDLDIVTALYLHKTKMHSLLIWIQNANKIRQ